MREYDLLDKQNIFQEAFRSKVKQTSKGDLLGTFHRLSQSVIHKMTKINKNTKCHNSQKGYNKTQSIKSQCREYKRGVVLAPDRLQSDKYNSNQCRAFPLMPVLRSSLSHKMFNVINSI